MGEDVHSDGGLDGGRDGDRDDDCEEDKLCQRVYRTKLIRPCCKYIGYLTELIYSCTKPDSTPLAK